MAGRVTVVVCLALAVSLSPAQSPAAEVTAEQVRTAIDKGVAFLKREQAQDGTWPDHLSATGGVTALCTLALLNAGVPVEDQHIQRALRHLRTLPAEKTYTVALQTMVFCMADPKADLPLIQRNARWLESSQIKSGQNRGAWGYGGAGQGDNSNSQFALLALHEAERVGIAVSDQTWTRTLEYWKACQDPTEGWFGYNRPGQGRTVPMGSMTCAGIAALVIAQGRLNSGDAASNGGIRCCGMQEADNGVDLGLDWLGRHFSVDENPGAGQFWQFYYLYGVERVGRLTSRRYFLGKGGRRRDWYREGAEMFVQKQDNLAGFWKSDLRLNSAIAVEERPDVATAFALLFLAKGRRPVLISKLQHGSGGDWNRHRSDLAHLTAYAENRWKRDYPLGLSWQIIDADGATVEDLRQTPVLFINGSQPLEISDEHARRLRDYIDRGGFIFAEACCPNSEGFDKSFQALMKKVFDPKKEPERQLKPLQPNHQIWEAEERVPPKLRPVLWGIDYGCRTCVVYCPPPGPSDPPHNLSCLWELAAPRPSRLDDDAKSRVAAALSLGLNVLAYATNRELKGKEENFRLADDPANDNFDRSKMHIAKLEHLGGCDAAPAALPNLLRAAGNEFQLRVATEQRLVPLTDPSLFKYHLVFMHGRHGFRFTPAEQRQLKLYVERGGTLLADSICSSKEFTAAFRREMTAIFGTDAWGAIPADHPMFGREFGGFDLASVSRRQPQPPEGDEPRRPAVHKVKPELEGLLLDDRYAVIFSPYDLSCALEKHDSIECEGYSRDDAERIGLNVLLYSLHQ